MFEPKNPQLSGQNTGKNWMVITWLVNNNFEPFKNLTTDRQIGWNSRAERAGVGGLLTVDSRNIYAKVKPAVTCGTQYLYPNPPH